MNAFLPNIPPPSVDWTNAVAEIDEAMNWLRSQPQGEQGAQIFAQRLREEIVLLTARIAEGYRPLLDEAASLSYSRPLYQMRFRTGKVRQARSSSGVWRVFYGLADTNGDGLPDELHVVSVTHAAAHPKDAWLNENSDNDA